MTAPSVRRTSCRALSCASRRPCQASSATHGSPDRVRRGDRPERDAGVLEARGEELHVPHAPRALACASSFGTDICPYMSVPPEPPTTERRAPTKAELRRIKRLVDKRRKQGEDVLTDDELERGGLCIAAVLEGAAPAAEASRGAAAPPRQPMRKSGSSKSLHTAHRNGSSKDLARLPVADRSQPVPITKAQLRKVKQDVAARRKRGEVVWTDDEVERLGYCLDQFALSRPTEVHPVDGMAVLVPKVVQEATWDCGLTCVHMALRALGMGADDCSLTYLRTRLPCDSVWTIDLAYLLAEFGVSVHAPSPGRTPRAASDPVQLLASLRTHALTLALNIRMAVRPPSPRLSSRAPTNEQAEYLTSTDPSSPDVNLKAFAKEEFYAECLDQDGARVQHMFRCADAEGIRVRKATLSLNEVCNLLRDEEHLIVALINSKGLYADMPWTEGSGFAGHYVLLVGVEDDAFLVKDPARKEGCLLLPCDDIDRARRALGTDEDLLLVPLNGPTPVIPVPGMAPKVVRLAKSAASVEDSTR